MVRKNGLAIILVGSLLAFHSGCGIGSNQSGPRGPEAPPTDVAKQPLPTTAPPLHTLEFEDAQDSSHNRPAPKAGGGASDGTSSAEPAVARTPVKAMSLSDDRVKELRQKAQADPGVKALLGDRYAFIEAESLVPQKNASTACCRHPAKSVTRLGYYSYSNNIAVDVFMRESDVLRTARREGYLPPEGEEDKKQAIDLAKKDNRLADKVQGLEGHAILMEPEEGMIWNDPGYGHRTLWVTFSHGKSGDPKYWAIVDLSTESVLEAGEEPKPE